MIGPLKLDHQQVSYTVIRDENGDDSSQKKKMKQGTLDSFLNVQNKRKTEDGLSFSSDDSSSETEDELDQETQDTEMGTMSGSDGGAEFDLADEMQLWENDHSNFGQLMKIVLEYSTRKVYRPPLLAPLVCLRYLLQQGLEIHGHEDEGLGIEANFVGLLQLLAKYDESIDEAAIENATLIHKDMINSCAQETTKAIVKDIAGDYFAILVDEYPDVSEDQQVALCLRYVDKEGDVVERFLGVENVKDGTALSLRDAIYSLLGKHSLSSPKIRGQGYNGLSNMQGDISGLRNLIKEENQSAYYSHCFVHQLQTTLVAISQQKVNFVGWFFYRLNYLTNVLGISWKDSGISKESRFEEVSQAFEDVGIEVARYLNQKVYPERLNDTWCRPYHKLVLNVIEFYPVILDMLDIIEDDSSRAFDRFEFRVACDAVLSFDFVFMAHVMKTIFEVTSELNIVLQKKDEEIAIAMSLVKLVKERLHEIRDGGWEAVLSSVISFCSKNDIKVPNMEDLYVPDRRRGDEPRTTNLHHYQAEEFSATIDFQIQELNSRFDEVTMELLVCLGSLSPVGSFRSFDKQKLLRLAEFYPSEFSSVDLLHLNDQLDKYIYEMKKDDTFAGLKDLGELSKKLVMTEKHEVFNLVYLLIKLALILPITTASVQRAFSEMAYVKSEVRKNTGDRLLNDHLVTYVERDVFCKISHHDILLNFQSRE